MLTLLAVYGCLILLQIQAVNFIMCTAILVRKCKLLSQGSLMSATLNRRRCRWQDQGPRRFWVRPGQTDHVYLRHLSTEYRSILLADMSAETRPILGRHVV